MVLHFKNKEAYHKWLAYGNMHGDFARVAGNQRIDIGGKPHKVKHRR
jgi:hypothetical protein